MPMMVQSTGSFSVSGVIRALDPCTISTNSPRPAPTVSTQTKVRPVPTSRSRCSGSTRSGSTVSSLRPVIAASFCVAITLPVTRARNIGTILVRFFSRQLTSLNQLDLHSVHLVFPTPLSVLRDEGKILGELLAEHL